MLRAKRSEAKKPRYTPAVAHVNRSGWTSINSPPQARSAPKERSDVLYAIDIGGWGTRASRKLDGQTDFIRIEDWGLGGSSGRPILPTLAARSIHPPNGPLRIGHDAKERLALEPANYHSWRHLKDALASALDDGHDSPCHNPGLLAERRLAERSGHDLLAYAVAFYTHVATALLRGLDRANVTILLSVPVRCDDAYATRYANTIRDIFQRVGASSSLTILLFDEPTAALFGVLPGFPHDVSVGVYTVGDVGAATFDVATMTVVQAGEPGRLPVVEFQTARSHWLGARRIIDAVEEELRSLLPNNVERAYLLEKTEEYASDPVAFLRRWKRPAGVDERRWQASLLRLEAGVADLCRIFCLHLANHLIDIKRSAKFTNWNHTVFLTGGGAAIGDLKPRLQQVFATDGFDHIKFVNTSEGCNAAHGAWRNQHVLEGLQWIAQYPELACPTSAPYDLYLTSYSAAADPDGRSEPIEVWRQGEDLCGPEESGAACPAMCRPVAFDLELGHEPGDLDRTFVFDAATWENRGPRPRITYTQGSVRYVSIDDVWKSREHNCTLDIENASGTACIYVWLQPYFLEVRAVIVYRHDGAKVRALEHMSLPQVLGGHRLRSTIDESLRETHKLVLTTASQIKLPREKAAFKAPPIDRRRRTTVKHPAGVVREERPFKRFAADPPTPTPLAGPSTAPDGLAPSQARADAVLLPRPSSERVKQARRSAGHR